MTGPAVEIELVRAPNPGPLTLTGTNTWLVDDGGGVVVVDPGPDLAVHLDAVAEAVARRGALAGIALTHRHHDHDEGVPALLARLGSAPVAAGHGEADLVLAGDDVFGPLRAIETPGHAPGHLAFVAGRRDAFTGDAVLGAGSVFVQPGPGSLAGYLAGLRRLRGLGLERLHPGHGPVVADAGAKLDEYIAHRLEREARLLAALDAGGRSVDELLDAAWDDAPPELRPAAALTLAAHLDKLAEDGRLPAGVERPDVPDVQI